MSDMVIHKERVSVELSSKGGTLSRGDVYLRPPGESGTDRGERLLDVLAERWFIPLQSVDASGAERMVFVSTRHVTWARMDLLSAVDELDPAAEEDESSCVARVLVELDDGNRVEGTVRYVAPPNARRLGDHLERLPNFFALRTDDYVYLINSFRVSSVTPLEEKR